MSETQIDNPRIEVEPAQDLVYEAVAPRIEINWDPQTDTGTVQFWVELEEYKNGVYQGRKPHKHWAMRPLSMKLEEVVMREYGVALPDGSTLTVPAGLLGLLVKTCFNDVFADRALQLPYISNDMPMAPELSVPGPSEPPTPITDDPLFAEPTE